MIYEVLNAFLNVCTLTSKRDEVSIRCPYCGDSQKNKLHSHFYIELESPHRVFCQKCNFKGILTTEILRDLGVYNAELFAMVKKSNKDFSKNIKFRRISSGLLIDQRVKLPLVDFSSELEMRKVEYIEKRLNFELTDELVEKFKIITNFKKFLFDNSFLTKYIKNDKRTKYLFKMFQKYCIGFLSTDRSTVIFRTIDKRETKFRYYIFMMRDNGYKMYTIKNSIDPLTLDVKINIAEGPLDVIGIYLFSDEKTRDSEVFSGPAGKNYPTVVNKFARLGFLNSTYNIFSDSEVKVGYYRRVLKDSLIPLDQFVISYNNKFEDFGTEKDNIEISHVKL